MLQQPSRRTMVLQGRRDVRTLPVDFEFAYLLAAALAGRGPHQEASDDDLPYTFASVI